MYSIRIDDDGLLIHAHGYLVTCWTWDEIKKDPVFGQKKPRKWRDFVRQLHNAPPSGIHQAIELVFHNPSEIDTRIREGIYEPVPLSVDKNNSQFYSVTRSGKAKNWPERWGTPWFLGYRVKRRER